MSQTPHDPLRRRFLRRASHMSTLAAAAVALPAWPDPARAALHGPRRLSLVHTHTGERISLAFAVDAHYPAPALGALDHFLRDHYSGAVGRMDPQLFELLHRVQRELGHAGAWEIISGFRGAATNARLRATRGGGVARHSLHMEGRAIDVRLPGVPLAELRDAAVTLRIGGVGFYLHDRFVHLDTGRVRAW
jgi:uncharacterized protein YcbK (DUF882 family)